jgi:hypothetical protein
MPAVDTYTLRRLLNRKKEIPQGVESRCINSIDYDYEQSKLTINFVERGTYEYYNVPLDVYVDLAEASSQGQYFNLYIRNAGYSFSRIG